jgi:hypothetical protein
MTRVRVTISTEVEVDLDPRVNGSLPYRFKHLDHVDEPDVEEFLLQLEYAALEKIRDGIRDVEGFEMLDDQEAS